MSGGKTGFHLGSSPGQAFCLKCSGTTSGKLSTGLGRQVQYSSVRCFNWVAAEGRFPHMFASNITLAQNLRWIILRRTMVCKSWVAAICASFCALLAQSAIAQTTASHGLYGSAGLIDMPTAGVFPDGETSWTLGDLPGSRRGSLNFQILPKLEGTVRYSNVDGLDSDGSSSFDMSFDLKYQLVSEDGWRPAIAIGLRDFLGHGIYAGEYVVASKTLIGGMTVTGGVGWGRLGSYNGFSNPLGLNDRPVARLAGGQFGANQWFRGDAAFFGGFEWDTPFKGLTMKAEYSSDAYVQESAAGGFSPSVPYSFGVEYAPVSGIHIGAYYLNGKNLAFALTFSGNPNDPITNPDAGLGPAPTMIRPPQGDRSVAWAKNEKARDKIMAAVAEALSAEGISVQSAQLRPKVVEIRISNSRSVLHAKAIGRTARILALAMPHSVETFRITMMQGGIAVSTVVVNRSKYEMQVDRPDAGLKSWQSVKITDAKPTLGTDHLWARASSSRFSWSINPSVPITFFNPNAPVTYDLLVNFGVRWQLSPTLAISGNISQHVWGSTDENAVGSEFDKTSKPVLSRLTIDKSFKLGDAVYGRAALGLLDKQYGGLDGEVLWKPVDQNWGLGLQMTYVRKRDPDNYFGFGTFETVTGHGSVYWDTGWNDITAQLDLGRYVAGDWGGTLTVARRFNNGWEVAGYMTRTDASYADFGEGAFDKGVRVSIPLRWTLPFETRSRTSVTFGTDGSKYGRRVGGPGRLYADVRDFSEQRMFETWGAFWQ